MLLILHHKYAIYLFYDHVLYKLARKATLVKAVPPFVHHIVRHADTQTDIVVAPLAIQGTDVPQNVINHMERTVTIHAVNTVTIETVTDITEVV